MKTARIGIFSTCGLTVVARNYRTPGGSAEVDLIARDGAWLVFVEVKTRQTDEFGAPDRAIDPIKRDKIRRAALQLLAPLWPRSDACSLRRGVDRRRLISTIFVTPGSSKLPPQNINVLRARPGGTGAQSVMLIGAPVAAAIGGAVMSLVRR